MPDNSSLDQPSRSAPGNLFDLAASLPDQIEHALKASRNLERLPERDRVENIVVLGMGDSGIAGDVLVSIASPFVPVPITVVKGYELPAYVGEGSLVFAISLSGDTEEVIESATEAAVQGAKVVVISGGGRLAELAGSWAAPLVRVPQMVQGMALQQSRSAFGELAIPALAILEDVGLFPGAQQWIDLAVDQARNRVIDLQQAGSPAERLAKELAGKLVVVHGGSAVGAAAAQRWKTQINVNARSLAFWSTQPELCHNEALAYESLADITREHVAVVALRHDSEHPQVTRRFDLMDERLASQVSGVHHVRAEGDGDLAQLLDLVLVGDFVSLHMAVGLGVDPAQIPSLESLKAALSER
jgi:glucose/mannose-6-phosphate isomerase